MLPTYRRASRGRLIPTGHPRAGGDPVTTAVPCLAPSFHAGGRGPGKTIPTGHPRVGGDPVTTVVLCLAPAIHTVHPRVGGDSVKGHHRNFGRGWLLDSRFRGNDECGDSLPTYPTSPLHAAHRRHPEEAAERGRLEGRAAMLRDAHLRALLSITCVCCGSLSSPSKPPLQCMHLVH